MEILNLTNPKKQIEEWHVVHVSNGVARDALTFIFFELPAKDVFIEETLQLFVGNVDAQLLKAVALKLLKAVNVQNADCHVYLPARQPKKTVSGYTEQTIQTAVKTQRVTYRTSIKEQICGLKVTETLSFLYIIFSNM